MSTSPLSVELPAPRGGAVSLPQAAAAEVTEFVRTFALAVRSYRLYNGDNPVLDRFISTLKGQLIHLFEGMRALELSVEEGGFLWEGQVVYPVGSDSGDLSMHFFRDGVRELVLLPGFEEEVACFLALVARASLLKEEEDDLTTLLWGAELQCFRYQVVEPGMERSGEISWVKGRGGGAATAVRPGEVREDAEAPREGIRAEDFQETLYFLDDAELRQLEEEVRAEDRRNLWDDVLSALFDRLEDGDEARQLRIVQRLDGLLAIALREERLDRAAGLVREMVQVADTPGVLHASALRESRALLARLAHPDEVRRLVGVAERACVHGLDPSFLSLLASLPHEALAPLMELVGEAGRQAEVRRALESTIERLAASGPEAVAVLLGHGDPRVVVQALAWLGRSEARASVPLLLSLLQDPAQEIRLAAILAAGRIHCREAGAALAERLEDPSKEVRIAAARTLSILRYAPAREKLAEAIQGRRLKGAERAEKIAFFEAYGETAGEEGIEILGRMLTGRSWLGRGEATEMRASAALGLGRIRHERARALLETASRDTDPVVRFAATRALRREEG